MSSEKFNWIFQRSLLYFEPLLFTCCLQNELLFISVSIFYTREISLLQPNVKYASLYNFTQHTAPRDTSYQHNLIFDRVRFSSE